MRKRHFILAAAAWLVTMTSMAQPMNAGQPGRPHALPQLHLSKTPNGQTAQIPTPSSQRSALNAPVVFTDGSRPRQALRAVSDADQTLFAGRTVFGAMVNSDLWANMSITQVPYGIYSFTMGGSDAPVAHITDMIYNFMSGAWGRDRHYGIVPLSILGAVNGARNITIDTRDWKETKNVMWDTSYGTYSLIASTMAYDPTSDVFYAFQYKEDLSGLNWVSINMETDQMEQIAQYRGTTAILTLAATPDGQMYSIDTAGDLYTVNKRNGRTSLVGNTGVTPSNYNQSMVYDGKSGTFLWAAQGSEGSVLYSVNPETAETKRVMPFQHNEQFVSLYITDTEAPAGAPAAVVRPQLRADSDGSLTGTLTFTTPSRTYDQQPLTADVNVNVWLDGENLKGEPVAPGTSVTVPVSVSEGNHYIAVTTDNEAGFSPLRYIYQYMGYDTPLPVSDVVLTSLNGQNTVTWKAPSRGINGGYVDQANIRFDIVRLPDNAVVATGLSAATFTEATPSAMHTYSYQVIADNNGHKSQPAESNRVLCGSSFTIPYEQQFADTTTLSDYFIVVDNDGDGNTWRQGYTTEVRMDYLKKNDADDWLISPPITMEAGMKYRFAMNMKIFTRNYPEDFEVLVGTDRGDLSTFSLVKREEGFTEIANEFADYTADFIISDTRDYYMAVRYCSKKDSNGSLLMINNFRVTAIGNSGAPAQPSDFAVTPDAADELKATVSLTAPRLNLMEESISSLTSIELYRDDGIEPIHTFTAPQPGQALSFTDEQVPTVGLHTYTAVANSEAGRGETVSAEQFIGIYTAPYTEDFEDRRYARLWTSEYNYTDDDNGWYGWQWKDNDLAHGRYMNLYYYLTTNKSTDIWLFTPKMRLEADAVYTVNYDAVLNYSYYPDMTCEMYQGTEPHAADMDVKVADLPSTGYAMTTQELMLVNKDGGRYNLGIKTHGAKTMDYFSMDLDNFALTYRTSARAPYKMTDYKSGIDDSGALKATLSLRSPQTNYYMQPLDPTKKLTVSVFRGQSATMPAVTFKVRPGELVTWTDEQALHGLNYYTVTCENEYGRGEVLRDTLFVGRDVPALVENFAVRGSADNKDAVVTWSKPAQGMNGGVVLDDETAYNVYEYFTTTGELQLLAENVKGSSYTVERQQQTDQELHYYAVSAVNSEGEGQALVASIVLGQVYTLPFHESFANANISTQLWQAVPMIEGATSCGVTNPAGASYNQCEGPQDEDGGCIYIYNGYQYELQAGALLVTPKAKLPQETGNELHFWAYHFKEVYSTPAYVQVAVSTEDSEFQLISGAHYEMGGDGESGWREHVVSLDNYSNNNFIALAFLGITSGYQDVIYLDNFSIVNLAIDGIDTPYSGRHTDVADDKCYDLQGRPVEPKNHRGIMVTRGKKVISPKGL